MKLVLSTLFFIVISINMYSQPWAQAGATWYYTLDGDGTVLGYVKITKSADTVIQGHWCDKLEKRAVGYVLSPPQMIDYVYGYEYTYTDNNVVYNWRNNAFFTLYDFNAVPGTIWTVSASQIGYGGLCGDSAKVIVTQTGTMNVGGQNRQYLIVQTDWGAYGFSTGPSTIIAGIGNNYSFIPDFLGCVVDANEMAGLRCYSDNTGFNYNTGIVPYCDYTTGINENIADENIIIFPNPSNSELEISNFNFHNGDEIVMTNTLGKIMFTTTIQFPISYFPFSISHLSNGIYFLQIKSKEKLFTHKIIVAH